LEALRVARALRESGLAGKAGESIDVGVAAVAVVVAVEDGTAAVVV
jgi:hypothetical protein